MTDWKLRIRRLRRHIRSQRKLLLAIIVINILVWFVIVWEFLPISPGRTLAPTQYLVNTPGCQMVEVDLFHSEVMRHLKEKPLPGCLPPVVVVANDTLAYSPIHKYHAEADCCYEEIHWQASPLVPPHWNEEGNVTYSQPCIPIPRTGLPSFPAEFLRITCKFEPEELTRREPETHFYAKPVPLERHSAATKAKLDYWSKRARLLEADGAHGQAGSPSSVLIILLSKFSRNDLLRSLPLTREFLRSKDFVELRGYTRIGDSTFENVLALLTGVSLDDKFHPAGSSCFNKTTYEEECPFIWRNFSERHYVTGLFQDTRSIPDHYWWPPGLSRQPTDYYGRPFTAARDSAKVSGHARQRCVGGRTGTELTMDYILDFVKITRPVPYFFLGGFFELTLFDSSNLEPWDGAFKNFWEQVMKLTENQPHEPLIFFVSDEGPRHGYIRTTAQGYYESNLPFALVRMPSALRKSFPKWFENLQQNSHALTVPYDLHATLEDLLLVDLRRLTGGKIANPSEPAGNPSPNSYSLFQEIPDTRTCRTARIPEDYCNCGVSVSNPAGIQHELARELVDTTIDRMNRKVKPLIDNNVCIRFEEGQVIELMHIWRYRDDEDKTVGNHEYNSEERSAGRYILHFLVPQLNIRYEAIYYIRRNGTVSAHPISVIPPDPRGERSCISPPALAQFCICRDYYSAFKELQHQLQRHY